MEKSDGKSNLASFVKDQLGLIIKRRDKTPVVLPVLSHWALIVTALIQRVDRRDVVNIILKNRQISKLYVHSDQP